MKINNIELKQYSNNIYLLEDKEDNSIIAYYKLNNDIVEEYFGKEIVKMFL